MTEYPSMVRQLPCIEKYFDVLTYVGGGVTAKFRLDFHQHNAYDQPLTVIPKYGLVAELLSSSVIIASRALDGNGGSKVKSGPIFKPCQYVVRTHVFSVT